MTSTKSHAYTIRYHLDNMTSFHINIRADNDLAAIERAQYLTDNCGVINSCEIIKDGYLCVAEWKRAIDA